MKKETQNNQPLPSYILNLFAKCEALKAEERLTTTFGANHSYDIFRYEGKFLIQQTGNYWKRDAIYESFKFATAKELNQKLRTIPYYDWYAKNHFTGKTQHMDNISNFCNAFKLETVETI